MAINRFNCIELLTGIDANEAARAIWETYDNKKEYVTHNKVVYKGSSYMCKQPCIGKAPTDTAYWLCIAEKGAAGTGLDVMGTYETLALLEANVTLPQQGDMYNVGSAAPYTLYMWDTTVGAGQWISQGQLQGPQGETGATGAKGDKGEKGDTGAKGDKGDTGNVVFATFEISLATGELIMTTPDEYNGAQFTIDNNGFLGVTI